MNMQVTADYSVPHLTLRTSVALANNPKVDIAATTGHKDITFGGEATYDSAKGDITKWSAGVGAFLEHSWSAHNNFICD